MRNAKTSGAVSYPDLPFPCDSLMEANICRWLNVLVTTGWLLGYVKQEHTFLLPPTNYPDDPGIYRCRATEHVSFDCELLLPCVWPTIAPDHPQRALMPDVLFPWWSRTKIPPIAAQGGWTVLLECKGRLPYDGWLDEADPSVFTQLRDAGNPESATQLRSFYRRQTAKHGKRFPEYGRWRVILLGDTAYARLKRSADLIPGFQKTLGRVPPVQHHHPSAAPGPVRGRRPYRA